MSPAITSKTKATIRIVNDGVMAHDTRVLYVAADGTETDISECVTQVEVDLKVGDLNTAKLHVVKVGIETRAHVEELIEREIKPRTRLRRTRRILDISTLGSRWRQWIAA